MNRLEDFRNDLLGKYELTAEQMQEVFIYENNEMGIEKPEWVSSDDNLMTNKLTVWDNEDENSGELVFNLI